MRWPWQKKPRQALPLTIRDHDLGVRYELTIAVDPEVEILSFKRIRPARRPMHFAGSLRERAILQPLYLDDRVCGAGAFVDLRSTDR